jgi:hypothetical protein
MTNLARLLRISIFVVLFTVLFSAYATMGQTETGTISGLITDETGASVPSAEVQLLNVQRGTTTDARTNGAGIYVFTGIEPGMYQIKVRKPGFKQVDLLSLIVNVQDHIEQNVRLQIGSVSESVTVSSDDLHINTQDATVSTLVDRQFAENLPMNGRTFQTLIELTPGVVVVPSSSFDQGQFSVNGQRASTNYWTVDGASANIGTSPFNPSNGPGGAVGSFSALGGTNSLVSVDALQEFRIQTSTFAPEFGRTPGAQISIVTRSGQNNFHGSAFDYFRNDVLDANDWFANKKGLPKPQERLNDFGGTFSGPILKNRTFFFFSYEGFRLRLPQTALFLVPSLAARQAAAPAVHPYLNLFPLPNGADQGDGTAEFNASYSNRSSLDAYSLRVDQKLGNRLNLFARYNYSPSDLEQRGASGHALSEITKSNILTQTATVGATWSLSATTINELRFNYSQVSATSSSLLDSFGGAIPLSSLPFPSPFNIGNARFHFGIFNFFSNGGNLAAGANANNVQHQINIVDSISLQKRSHSLKFGIDYRRLTPLVGQLQYGQSVFFDNMAGAISNNVSQLETSAGIDATLLFRNLSFFAQDTWHAFPRLTITYGLRWDTDFAPVTLDGPPLPAVTGFNLADLSKLALAPPGTPVFKTPYRNFAPRVGAAYQANTTNKWTTVVRGGFGMFYDLATSDAGNAYLPNGYPLGINKDFFSISLPLTPAQAAPPTIMPPDSAQGELNAFDPHLRTPYTLQWNVALEQALGSHQTISATYVGAAARRLIQSATAFPANQNLRAALLLAGLGYANYNALQVKFDRRMSHGVQALASYTWSHSIDTGSTGSFDKFSNQLPSAIADQNRGDSDFDIRHSFSAGFTYQVPSLTANKFARAVSNGWSLQSVVQARSAPPSDVSDINFFQFADTLLADVRPDAVPGQPRYLFGPQFPGGKAFNAAAYTDPPGDPNTGVPLRQGNVSRNSLRGFGATQWDCAIHRNFAVNERINLQFRAEMFNILNHPNFGQPDSNFGSSRFGQSSQMLGRSLAQGAGSSGGLSPLFQIGGPRSVQLALKLQF